MKYIILFLFSINVAEAIWSEDDQQRQLAYTFLHIADWGQTLDIVENPHRFKEMNGILGSHPTRKKVNIFMASTLIGHWVISKKLASSGRKTFQRISLIMRSMGVARNNYIGLHINF